MVNLAYLVQTLVENNRSTNRNRHFVRNKLVIEPVKVSSKGRNKRRIPLKQDVSKGPEGQLRQVLVSGTVKVVVEPESLFNLETESLERGTFFGW